MNRIWLLIVLVWGFAAGAADPIAKPSAIEPVVQEGHSGDGDETQFALSPDGKWVVSSSLAHLKLWNTRGELWRDLEQSKFAGEKPIFSPDSRQLFLTGSGGTAVYSIPSGQKIRDLKSVEWSNDTRFSIRRTDKIIQFSDAKTGKRLSRVTAHFSSSWPETLDFSPDGNFVAAGQINHAYSDGKMRIWNIRSGKLVQTLSDPRGEYGKAIGVLGPALWSNDGKILVTGGANPDFGVSSRWGSFAVKVWDIATGKLLRVWPLGNDPLLREFISAHQVTLSSEGDSSAGLLDIWSGKETQYREAAPSKHPQIVYLDPFTGYFELRDRSGKKTLQKFPTRGFAGFDDLAYSPDSALIAATGSGDSSVKIYNARSGALQTITPAGSTALRWLPDGNLSASGSGCAWIWAPDGRVVRHFVPPTVSKHRYEGSVSVSPDGQLFLSDADTWNNEKRSMAHVWNQKGELLHDIPDFRANDSTGWRMVWIDGSRVALTTKTGFEVWDLGAGTREISLEKSTGWEALRPVFAAPDGTYLLTIENRSGNDPSRERAVLLDTETWKRTQFYEDTVPLSWSGDSTQFIACHQNGQGGTLIFSPHSEEPLQKLPLDASLGRQIAFSPNFQFAVLQASGHSSTHSEIRRVASGELAVSLYLFANENKGRNSALSPDTRRFWLALTPDNFYDGSPGVEKWLRWRQNGKLLPVGALQNILRQPAKVRSALR